jgi:hypothetical protein
MTERHMVSIPRCLIVCWAVVGLGVAGGNGRSAVAQVPAAQLATADPSTFKAPPAPSNPEDLGNKDFSVSNGPSLVYWTVRDPKTGVASLSGLSIDPSSKNKNLVVQAKKDAKSLKDVFVSLTFTCDSLSKLYFVKVPIASNDSSYTVTAEELNNVLGRLMADLNSALPLNFDPDKPFGYNDSVKVGITPIDSVTPAPATAKDHTPKYTTGTAITGIDAKLSLRRILSPDETLP